MKQRPAYFDGIQARAARRWEQLEADPELAGPWHQLFKQVQSPSHVISELLQNADDAGATEAWARIEDGLFVFEHNGEDFTEDHFSSLCRFGYSNKRSLHTIGFRGIGFKSTFSLGDRVDLQSPSLSVSFERKRFTEPRWTDQNPSASNRTRIQVAIADRNREHELSRNLTQWLESAVSLLFFKHIRRITIGDAEVHWGSLGPGPVDGTEWMALHEDPDRSYLMARSGPEPFPAEVLAEIKQERMLGPEEGSSFPPCTVEIVLGSEGRLFVVLPTGVKPNLPFAVNAPFIQDPARLKIKDPETSPTNRWLLKRAGALAANVMLRWLYSSERESAERAQAYDLMPDVDRDESSMEGICASIIRRAFEETIENQAVLLIDAREVSNRHRAAVRVDRGEIVKRRCAVMLPEPLADIWPLDKVLVFISIGFRGALSRHVSSKNRKKLARWGLAEEVSRPQVVSALIEDRFPKPGSWRQLLELWTYVEPEVTGYSKRRFAGDVRIVPVQGSEVLHAAREVVRLGEKKLLQSDEDWQLLSHQLLVMNQNWPRYLAEQRREAEERDDSRLGAAVQAAFDVLSCMNLDESSDSSRMVELAAKGFFSGDAPSLSQCVQLAQVVAKLGATAGPDFRFVARDGKLRSEAEGVLVDRDGQIEQFFPEEWRRKHILHSDYTKHFDSCSSDEWQRWVESGRAGLLTFAPITRRTLKFRRKDDLEKELTRRGFRSQLECRYKNPSFAIEDWDFAEELWTYWEDLSSQSPDIWANVAERVLHEGRTYFAAKMSAALIERGRGDLQRKLAEKGLTPSWALRLADRACLRDTRGIARKPGDLLRRTPVTESLLDVEPFLHATLDFESARPVINLLGVRDTPTGPDQLIERIRALATTDRPPAYEVEKWYRRLDQLIDGCTTADLLRIKEAFRSERLILSAEHGWTNASGVFLTTAEQDVPGAAVIREAVADLAIWRKVGVADYPTADLAVAWLSGLPEGEELGADELRRIRALQSRHAARIWVECGHWLNLVGEWVRVESLCYTLTMQNLVPWGHLYSTVKQKTADLQKLSREISGAPPFSALPSLGARLEERLNRSPSAEGEVIHKPWLIELGAQLRRIVLEDEDESARTRQLGANLARTRWRVTPGLEVTPYIDGTPAGSPRHAAAAWLSGTLFVEDWPIPKLADPVAHELGRAFGCGDIADAIRTCFERDAPFVAAYMRENFHLVSQIAESEPIAESVIVDRNAAAGEDLNDSKVTQGSTGEDCQRVDALGGLSSTEESLAETEAVGVEGEGTCDTEIEIDTSRSEEDSRQRAKPARLGILERYAASRGFWKEGDGRFAHSNGSWIERRTGTPFPWELHSPSGELVRSYWPKDHCLENQPLELGVEVWTLINEYPARYALILASTQGEPVEINGDRLQEMKERGVLKLYPSTYRVVYAH